MYLVWASCTQQFKLLSKRLHESHLQAPSGHRQQFHPTFSDYNVHFRVCTHHFITAELSLDRRAADHCSDHEDDDRGDGESHRVGADGVGRRVVEQVETG